MIEQNVFFLAGFAARMIEQRHAAYLFYVYGAPFVKLGLLKKQKNVVDFICDAQRWPK